MIEVSGQVVSVDGASVTVRVDSRTGCGRCHEPGGCGGTRLTHVLCSSPRDVTAVGPADAKVGEEVIVTLSEAGFFRSVVAGYGIPLAGVLSGAAAGFALFGESGSIALSVVGFCAAWAIVRRCRWAGAGLSPELRVIRRARDYRGEFR